MAQHETKFCPRCNKAFECKCGSINLCQCAAANLSEHLRQHLQQQFDDCLCIQCLREYQNDQNVAATKTTITAMKTLIMNR
ncbi:MAG: cysteine-rich CWC family protein [Gammaproteobacteria bacterium]|nr:cysteine-rich CWC family protein [Gammaproteobacteria bacterium]